MQIACSCVAFGLYAEPPLSPSKKASPVKKAAAKK
jgi:hypothetical protein